MPSYVADPVYLNGQFLPLAEAGVSPLDRGFLYGDGVYELIPVYSRRAFRIDEHLHRLATTLAGIKLANPLDHAGWKAVVEQLIADAPWDDQSIYLQVTRGADNKRDHAFPPASVPPTAFAFSSPLVTTPPDVRARGVSAITVADQRWARCDLKVISLLANVLARQQAVEDGCAEALLIRDGWLKEGAASNIFIVKDGVLLAPPKTHLMLPGITYDIILELAEQHRLPLEVRAKGVSAITVPDLRWSRCDLKVISLLANVLARQQAVEQGCAEALLMRDGFMKEGAASNIFIVKDGVLCAPPKTHLMLPGITYDVILELAESHGQPVKIAEIEETELRSADEVWMTSSTKEILAITSLDGAPVGTGKPGPLAAQMWQWYQDFKNTVMRKG